MGKQSTQVSEREGQLIQQWNQVVQVFWGQFMPCCKQLCCKWKYVADTTYRAHDREVKECMGSSRRNDLAWHGMSVGAPGQVA